MEVGEEGREEEELAKLAELLGEALRCLFESVEVIPLIGRDRGALPGGEEELGASTQNNFFDSTLPSLPRSPSTWSGNNKKLRMASNANRVLNRPSTIEARLGGLALEDSEDRRSTTSKASTTIGGGKVRPPLPSPASPLNLTTQYAPIRSSTTNPVPLSHRAPSLKLATSTLQPFPPRSSTIPSTSTALNKVRLANNPATTTTSALPSKFQGARPPPASSSTAQVRPPASSTNYSNKAGVQVKPSVLQLGGNGEVGIGTYDGGFEKDAAREVVQGEAAEVLAMDSSKDQYVHFPFPPPVLSTR